MTPRTSPQQSTAILITADGGSVSVQELRVGAAAFGNRSYVWESVPDQFRGWKFTRINGGAAPFLHLNAPRETDVYIAKATPPAEEGWQAVPNLALIYSDKGHTRLAIYRRHLAPGSGVDLPQSGWAGTIVLAPDIRQDSAASGPIATASSPPPGTVIEYCPETKVEYVGSPAIAILPDGSYVAAHDFFGHGEGSDSRVFRSEDRGKTWTRVSDLKNQYWSSLFVQKGALYILGTSKGFGDIVIRRSDDGGRTWTRPQDAGTGRLRTDGKYHCAPTPVLIAGGRLWRAFEKQPDGVKNRHFGALLLSAPLDADLLRADSWTSTAPLSWAENVTHGNWLEGNAVAAPDGGIVDILRIDAGGAEKAAILHLSPDGRTLDWNPARDHIPFPGGKVKFTIRWDPTTRRYWALVNKKSNPAANRNVLALTSSPDLYSWRVAGTVLSHPSQGIAFQYVDWLFEGDDLIVVSRTAWGHPNSYHNANYLTFHRIRHFRDATRTVE